jgi:hypothetical protein
MASSGVGPITGSNSSAGLPDESCGALIAIGVGPRKSAGSAGESRATGC